MPTMDEDRWRRTNAYLQDVFGRDDALLRDLRAAATAEGLPEIAISSDVGRFLQLMVRTTRARRIVELGTLGGYSAVWLARALAPGGRLTTVEIDPRRADFARGWIARAGLADRVEVVVGAALEVLPGILRNIPPGELDVAFVDAVKTEYPAYFAALRGHLAPGGLYLADNALGSMVWWIDQAGHPDRDAVDRANRLAADDPDFEVACVPLREGVMVARRR
jgi:predicted O-methyltransferase YrrM